MSSRIETEERRNLLRMALRNECLAGGRAPNSLLPAVRQLAAEHGVSSLIVSQVLSELEREGLVYTVHRVGTFIGRPVTPVSEYYLLLLPYVPKEHDQAWNTQMGFEERIAQLGGASLSLQLDEAVQYREAADLPPLAGIFDCTPGSHCLWQSDQRDPLPMVRCESRSEEEDTVSFDSINGGRQAAQYLLGLSHKQIAYIGLHALEQDPGIFIWSADREEGWRQVMSDAGQPTDGLAFHVEPEEVMHNYNESAVRHVALALLARPDVTAVVTANDCVAMALFSALRATCVPDSRWPAVVSFDNRIHASRYLFTSFNLPWEELGRTAADIVWQRRHGLLSGPPVHRLVQMRMIQRLTSRACWSNITPTVTQSVDVSAVNTDISRNGFVGGNETVVEA